GSAGEVRSMLCLKERRAAKDNWPADLKSQISDLKSIAESCSCQLCGWADSLQNSEIKGQRHLTEKSRRQDDQKRRAAVAQKDLLEKLPPNHPLRMDAQARTHLKSQIPPAYPTYRCAIGMRRPTPKARLVTFNPGAAWARLYSLRSTRRCTQRTVASSNPCATISAALKFSSTYNRKIASSTSYGGRVSWSFWFGRSSALGALSIVETGMISPFRLMNRASS